MNSTQQPIPSPREVVHILAVHRKRWLVPAAVVGTLVLLYAVFRPATWEASQGLIVRNEAANNQVGPGKFGDVDEMKIIQETILELARSCDVLGAALEEVGPPRKHKKNIAWPTPKAVERLRKRIKLVPPKGAEFGTTEIFYLRVRDHDRSRAIALSRAICGRLQARSQQLRDAKAQSMIDELAKTVQLAKTDLDVSTARLTAIEKQVGSDLGELRALEQAIGSDSALRRTAAEIRNELRQLHADERSNQQLLALLRGAQDDPGRLVATPSGLLDSQPALRRLKDGLVDAQLDTAVLKGRMLDEHPLVAAAKGAEEEIGRHMHNELAIAIRGVETELRISGDRRAMLRGQLAEATERLDGLAALRAPYANLVAETKNRTVLVERAEQNLAEARATHAGAKATSLISRIGTPDTGANPVGPSRAMIVLVGLAGGLLTGFGVLFLTVQPAQSATAVQAAPRRRSTAIQPGSALSLKQALQKIVYGSTA